VRAIEALYRQVLARRDSARIPRRPGPWRVTFDTNPDTCNLRCIMCEEHSPHSLLQVRRKEAGKPRRVMPLELLRRVFAEAAANGMREMIPSTMGEPLLYEHFEAILELCRTHSVKLNLTTNGTFPRLGARAWAERIVPVTSDTKISWNGATAKTHEQIMIGSRWDRVVANVREFIAVRDAHAAAAGNRCRVTFQLTFLESNVGELADVVRLGLELGVDRIKGHHLWAHFDAIKGLSMRRDAAAIARWNVAVAEAQAVAQGTAIQLDNIFPLDPDARDDIAPGGPCPFLGQEAWISAEGRFDPCCAPDAQRRTLGEFGSLHDHTLKEIWTGDAYQRLQATYRNRELCLGCNMRKPTEAT
jgi:MoaA/NifB/PqqE/SkfB family radical SAM enzyme